MHAQPASQLGHAELALTVGKGLENAHSPRHRLDARSLAVAHTATLVVISQQRRYIERMARSTARRRTPVARAIGAPMSSHRLMALYG